MNKKKIIAATAILLLTFIVGGAVAYFTDVETVTNTFTIGSVKISLTEPAWEALADSDQNGKKDAAENMMYGDTVAKNPIITNISPSNSAYVFATVEIPCTSNETHKEVFSLGTIGSGWTLMSAGTCTENATSHKYSATKIFNYGTSSSMTALEASEATSAVFNTISLSSAIDGSEEGLTGDLDVVVTGYAIQVDGIETPAVPTTVWDNF